MNDWQPDRIAVDWGSTRLRAWAVSEQGEVLDQLDCDRGMAVIAAEHGDFELELLAAVETWLVAEARVPVIACGMVGARNGWVEAPYEHVPCAALTDRIEVPNRSKQIEVSIHRGVQQTSPADVMRGEETIISGLLHAVPHFDGVACLPGTHSKWVRVRHAQIEQFRTFMTGELFAVLSKHSLLQHSISTDGLEPAPFLVGVQQSLEDPAGVLRALFGLRADSLLHQTSGLATRSKLSGLLVGLELAGVKEFCTLKDVALIATGNLATIYELALNSIGCQTTHYDPEKLVLAGLMRNQRHP